MDQKNEPEHFDKLLLSLYSNFSLLACHRRWVHLVMKGKETTLTSGQFSVGDLCGSVKKRSVFVIKPRTLSCQWRASSTDSRSVARGRFTPCPVLVSTACGRSWRESLWSPVRPQQAAEPTLTSTQSSEQDSSSQLLSLPAFPPVCHSDPTSVPNLHLHQQPLFSALYSHFPPALDCHL